MNAPEDDEAWRALRVTMPCKSRAAAKLQLQIHINAPEDDKTILLLPLLLLQHTIASATIVIYFDVLIRVV
jgi:hypothetical protein